MKKFILSVLLCLSMGVLAPKTFAESTTLTGYASYWEGEDDAGVGGGLRLKRTFLGFGSAEMKGGYVAFDSSDSSKDPNVIPLEVAASVRLPFFISPYLGVGVGYYLTSDIPHMEDETGYFVQAGVEFTLFVVGAMAEVRWQDINGEYLDGMSANLGILIKW